MEYIPLTRRARRGTSQLAFGVAFAVTLALSESAFGQIADKPLFLTGPGLPPNILLIPDTSESMQEGLDGRVALDWNTCVPGPDLDPEQCPAGARYAQSKGSIVKRVGNALLEDYQGRINLGLMSYQQYPAGREYNDALIGASNPRTVAWRLYHRPFGVTFFRGDQEQLNQFADFDPNHEEAWDSPLRRYADPHPSRQDQWFLYNDAIPGYERTDFTEFCRTTGAEPTPGVFNAQCFADVSIDMANNPSFIGGATFTGGINIVDSLRQRGIPNWGAYLNYLPLNQWEWRATQSPGLGFLHVPIGGFTADGSVDVQHWDWLRAKLAPQPALSRRWQAGDGNLMIDPDYPLVAAGLTPIEGTMRTARRYFLGQTGADFGPTQGSGNNRPIPESCDVNAAIWVTDGLPSVRADGVSLGENPITALQRSQNEIASFHDDTGVDVYIVGFNLPPGVAQRTGTDRPLDDLAAAGGTGMAFDATTEDSLDEAMNNIFETIVAEATGSAASVAANTTSLQAGAAVFRAGFDSTDWSGELQAFRLTVPDDPNGQLVSETPAWDAEQRLPPPLGRTIITWVPDTEPDGSTAAWSQGDTVEFLFGNLSENQQNSLDRGDGRGPDRLAWLRGDQSEEGFETSSFRVRQRLLGDVVYSQPLFIANQNFGYETFASGGASYEAALAGWASQPPLVAVGANDGKLHFFDGRLPCAGDEPAENCSGNGGTEVFAVVPNAVYGRLAALTDQNYDRRYVLDGSPRLGHVFDGSWRRIVVTSLGAGGRAVFAVDVDSREILWEIDATHVDTLGHVIGTPVMGRSASGRWITAIPNGYDSLGGGASLIILDTLSGELIAEWRPESSSGNGMFSPLPVDSNGDRRIDRLYAGDLNGNLWRVDFDGNQIRPPNNLLSGNTPLPLFRARSAGGEIQPITSRPAVARDPQGRLTLFFGTGKFFEVGDNEIAGQATQSFYGVRDFGSGGTVARGNLVQQTIEAELEGFGFELRVTSDNQVNPTDPGWVLDLLSPVNGFEGERVVEDPIIRSGDRVVFSTLIPLLSDDPCAPAGGTGWVMELDAFSGGRLERSPWNLSGEGFGESSFVNVPGFDEPLPVQGIRSPHGIPTRPTVLEPSVTDPNQGREFKLPVGSSGEIWEMPEEERAGFDWRRWRQLQ